jgi:uroporphyrinogen decarboxylase
MRNEELFSPLSKDDVAAAVEGRAPRRVPLVRAKWWGEGLEEQYGKELKRFDDIPEDVVQVFMDNPVDPGKMNLSWTWQIAGAHDSRAVIDDWSKLDEFIDKLPDPATDPDWAALERIAERAHKENRYLLYSFWTLFFERPWMIRGMENLMIDYYVEPDKIAQLHGAMAEQYSRYIAEACRRLEPDGFFTSDDLGHQTGPMMSPGIFHDLIYPHYCTVGATIRDAGMHFWLHSCGDNTLLLPDLIDAGVDVFHPVQKHTMNEAAIAAEFGGKITFLVGVDVQHVLQEADPDGVREEVRFLIDTFDRPEGRMCIAAGNGIVAGTPIDNIEAFLDEAVRYGADHRVKTTERGIL